MRSLEKETSAEYRICVVDNGSTDGSKEWVKENCPQVKLIELRIARGMCGKSYMLLTGTVASVTAAIENAMKVVGENGMLLDHSVIPNPDPSIWDSIL